MPTPYPFMTGPLPINQGLSWETFNTAAAIVVVMVAAFVVFALYKALQLWKKPPKVAPIVEGEKVVPDKDAKADEETFVLYRGEYWKARSPKGIAKGKAYRVSGKDGTVLIIEPME